MSHSIRAIRVATIIIVAVLIWNEFGTGNLVDTIAEAEAATEMMGRDDATFRTPISPRGVATRPEALLMQARPVPSPSPAPTSSPLPTAVPTMSPVNLGVFKVTGYSDAPLLNGTDGRGITRSGERTRWGVVAVDPGVVALGTRLTIENYEGTIFTALDTGGGIKGHWIDIWFPTDADALRHGVKELKIHKLPD